MSTSLETTTALTGLTTIALAEMWHDAKRDELAADKIRKAAAALRGEIARECDTRLDHGDTVTIHQNARKQWDVCEYDVTAKAAVLDALRPFLTPELADMVKTLEQANQTHVRKLAFKPVKP